MSELLLKMARLLYGAGEVSDVHYVRRENRPLGVVGRGWTVTFYHHPVRVIIGQNGKEAALNLCRRFADALADESLTIEEARLLALRAVLRVS